MSLSSYIIPIPESLSPSKEDLAICVFVENWVLHPHDALSDRGLVELIPIVHKTSSPSSPLSLCLTAIASTVFTKFLGRVKDAETPWVRQHYAKALHATRQALQDPIESFSDATLMAVCLLGFYEACVMAFRARVSSTKHFDGAAALIERRQSGFETDLARRMLLGLRNAIVSRKVLMASPIDQSSSLYRTCELLPQNPATFFDGLTVDVTNLLAEVKTMGSGSAEATEVLLKAQKVDAKLSAWSHKVPKHWIPFRLSAKDVPTEVLQAGIYGDYCDIYHDIVICSLWNDWRQARLRVLAVIARLTAMFPGFEHETKIPSQPSLRSEAIAKIQPLADDICATVPFCLGSRLSPAPLNAFDGVYPTSNGHRATREHHQNAVAWGGWLLLSPMKQVLAVGMYLRPGQIAWAGPQLQRLANIYDIEPEEDDFD